MYKFKSVSINSKIKFVQPLIFYALKGGNFGYLKMEI